MSEDWANPPSDEPANVPTDGEQPPAPPKRYETRPLLISMLITGLALSVGIPLTLFTGPLAGFSILALPVVLVVGIVKHRRSQTIQQRSVWMGVVLGAAISPIIGAGVCIAVVNGMSGA